MVYQQISSLATHLIKNCLRFCHMLIHFFNFDNLIEILWIKCFDNMELDLNYIPLLIVF
jgi:hypothetical protein